MMRTKQTSGPISDAAVAPAPARATQAPGEWPDIDVRIAALALFTEGRSGDATGSDDLGLANRLVAAADGDRRALTSALEVLWHREVHSPDETVGRAIRIVRLALLQTALQRAYTR